jgi:glycosyltransferase involved in cell wall biosynthesis
VFEAMSASAIVLASATSSLPEVLGDGITFDPYRTDAIAAALLHALSMTPAQAAAYRRRCRERADALRARAAQMPALPGLPMPSITVSA